MSKHFNKETSYLEMRKIQGATTLSITTLIIVTFSIVTLSIVTFSIMTHNTTTFSIIIYKT